MSQVCVCGHEMHKGACMGNVAVDLTDFEPCPCTKFISQPTAEEIMVAEQPSIINLDQIVAGGILYSLRMDYVPEEQRFQHVLHASGPMTGHVDIFIAKDLGDILAQNWKQNEYGSFLGRHNMDWIIMCLSNGRPI